MPVRVPDAGQRERTQTSIRSLRKFDCCGNGAPLVQDRCNFGMRKDPGSAAHHAKPRAALRPGNAGIGVGGRPGILAEQS